MTAPFRDGERRANPDAVRALQAWLDANGLRHNALIPVLNSSAAHVSRMFSGSAYLSATQRRALEQFTGGAVTADALCAKLNAAAPPPVPKPVVAPRAPHPEPQSEPAPRIQTTEDAQRIVDELAAKAMPAAFKLVVQQMVQAKSESERRRCAEILIEQFRGKARQREEAQKKDDHLSAEDMSRELMLIEERLLSERDGTFAEGAGI